MFEAWSDHWVISWIRNFRQHSLSLLGCINWMQDNLQWGRFTTYHKREHEHHLPQSKLSQALQTCAKCQGHGLGPSDCHVVLKKKKQ